MSRMRIGFVVASWALGSVALSFGCSARPAQGDDGDPVGSTSDAPTIPPDSPTVPPETTGATTFGTSGSGDGSLDSSDDGVADGAFFCNVGDEHHWYCQPDGGTPVFECDLFAQDCARGEKCMPWANDGGSVWNGSHCTPVTPEPVGVGENCAVEGSGTSGFDTCELGVMCWGVDPITDVGECVAICDGHAEAPECAAGTRCKLTNEGAISLCLPVCNPLAADCGDGELCVPDRNDEWSCVPGLSTPAEVGQPCDFGNACEAGSVCADPVATAACEGSGCCAPICNLQLGDCADPATTCVPWYEPGAAPAGFEDTGICSVTPEAPKDGWLLGDEYPVTADPG